MRLGVLATALWNRNWLTYIYFLVTLITAGQAAYSSSITVGSAAFVGCALAYIGPAGFVGSYLARRQKHSTAMDLTGTGVVAVVLTVAGVWLLAWSGFWINILGVSIQGPYWALIGSGVALVATRAKDVLASIQQQQRTSAVAASTTAPQGPSMERLMVALDKVNDEFIGTVGAIPSVQAAIEYMRLPGFLEEPAMTAAFMTVALVAARKYETFFNSQLYADFRDGASKKMIAVLAEPHLKDLGQDGARRYAYSIADHEFSRCQHAVSEAIHNLIEEKQYPLNPVFTVINNRLRLAYKQNADGQVSPVDIEQNYRPIFTKLAELAGLLV